MTSAFTGRLHAKVALMAAAGVLLAAVTLVLLFVWQSDRYNSLAQGEVDALLDADLDHITQGVYNLVRTEDVAVQAQVDTDLAIARHLLAAAGGVQISQELTSWQASNQFTKKSTTLHLPRFLVGTRWLGKNTDPTAPTPVVDEVTRLTGETATLFQRMNPQGDMLRVATTVQTLGKARAIGTYIPAINPDGGPNPVISSVLRGETYHGRAYVVNDWYLTAYEPIHDQENNLVGMLYVGVRQAAVASRIRSAILQSTVGKTGYVYVLGGGGEDRGRYIISRKGERDGEDIWSAHDSDGRYVVQEIIAKATSLQPGQMATVRYRWQNPGEPAPRWRIARIAYYQPWDWVIGTSVYEDELQAYSNLLQQGRLTMIRFMAMAGLGITVFIALVTMGVIWSVTRPIRAMTRAAQEIIAGDLNKVVKVESRDEIGLLAQTFNRMTAQLKHSLDELKNSEEKYRGIVENALEGMYQSTLEGRFLSVNPALATILGYDSPEQLLAELTDLRQQLYVHPPDRDVLVSLVKQQQTLFDYEVEYYRRDGSTIWVSISARLRQDGAGEFRIIEGFINDISARRAAEEALADSRNYLDEIINSIGDPIFVKDGQQRWVLVNNALCAFVGRCCNDLVGRIVEDLLPGDMAGIFRAHDGQVLATGRESLHEATFTGTDGRIRTIVTRKSLYTDKKGEQFIVGVIRDITDLKQAEAEQRRLETQLIQAQKMEAIGTLAGGIAHDFNNILQPMLGYSELLQRRLADNCQKRYVEQIYSAGLRAKELVNQILTFSRQSERKAAPVRVQSIVKEVLKLGRSTIPANIRISKQIQEDCPAVCIDPGQLHQVIMNLVINAYHAVEKTGGEIAVQLGEQSLSTQQRHGTALPPGRYVRLSVTDTGSGIDQALLGKIFEPYFTTKEQGKGTGLGLAVVYGIVKECGGEIVVRSEPGQGTSFTIYLPITQERQAGVHPADIEQHPTGHERILLVDDDPMVLELERQILELLGYRVSAVKGSLEALAIFKADPQAFDLVISDLTMPEMTGDELTAAVLALKPDLPVILCSGFSEKLGDVHALGVQEVLMKPISLAAMAQKVRKVLDLRPR